MRRLRDLVEDGHVHQPSDGPHGPAGWSVVMDGDEAFVDCVDCARRFPEQVMVLRRLPENVVPFPTSRERCERQRRRGRC